MLLYDREPQDSIGATGWYLLCVLWAESAIAAQKVRIKFADEPRGAFGGERIVLGVAFVVDKCLVDFEDYAGFKL